MRAIEMLPIKAVDDYYDLFDREQKVWTAVHSKDYMVKTVADDEPVSMPIEVYKNKYGDTHVVDGMCVRRHVVIDSRGWIIEYLDEDPYAMAYIPDWIDLVKFRRRFTPSHIVVTTMKQLDEDFEGLRNENRELRKLVK